MSKWVLWSICAVGAVVILIVCGALWLVFQFPDGSFASVSILILVGLGAFLGIMNFLSFSAAYLGIGDPRQAFGLPDGTVRAILTIAFLVLVGVLASFLLTHSGGRQPFAEKGIVIKGLSTADAQMLQQRLSAEGLAIIVPEASASADQPRNELQFYARTDYRLADDVAKQVLTILSTILAAMIGFYFGARPADPPRGIETGERDRIVAEVNAALTHEPTVASIRRALDSKTVDAAHQAQANRIKADLAETETRIEGVRKTVNDRASSIDKVRAAQADTKAATDKLADIGRQVEQLGTAPPPA
jgi:hypothetical protein